MAEQKRIYEDFESYDDEPVEEKYRKPTAIGIIMRVIFYIFIVFVNGAIIFRICAAEDPGSVTSPDINDTLKSAFEENSSLTVQTQTIFDMYTEDGIFYSTGLFFFPEAKELQVSVRYNVRTMPDILIIDELGLGFDSNDELSEDIRQNSKYNDLSGDTVKNNDYFAFRLVDDNGNKYEPTKVTKLPRFLYVYHTLTFDGVESEDTNLYVEIYLLRDGEPDYSAYVGRMKVLSKDREIEEYELTRSDLSKLQS